MGESLNSELALQQIAEREVEIELTLTDSERLCADGPHVGPFQQRYQQIESGFESAGREEFLGAGDRSQVCRFEVGFRR